MTERQQDAATLDRNAVSVAGCEGETFRSALLREEYVRLHHPSGLEILIFPKQMMLTTAMLVVRFGAADVAFRLPGERRFTRVPNGVAHFLEHKMFENPDGSEVNEQFSAFGADANAWTDLDRTAFLCNTTAYPERAFGELLQFVTTPHFTPESVTRERGIIGEEIGADSDDPWERLREQTMRAMYARHPVRERICGSVTSIGKITDRVLYDCYRAFYRPENMFLVVCGALTPEAVLNVVDRVIPGFSDRCDGKSAGVIRKTYAEPPRVCKTRVTSRAEVAKPLFQIGWKDTAIPAEPAARLRRETAMGVLSEILFSQAGRFYSGLFERGKITTNYDYGYSISPWLASHMISGETDDADAVFDAYRDVLEQTRREGISPADFERCRRVLYAGMVSEYDSPGDIADLMVDAESDGVGLFDALGAIRDLTIRDVETMLSEAFSPEQTTLSVIFPKSGAQRDTKK